ALPPCEEKADWDDYRQRYGLQSMLNAFEQTLIVSGAKTDPKSEPVEPEPTEREPVSEQQKPDDPLQPWAELRDGG
uniref:hypothetical protein n=1 Tax=Xenorhabdus sp. Sc-CR9 TaxID=2584468 RepID=UPI001F253952